MLCFYSVVMIFLSFFVSSMRNLGNSFTLHLLFFLLFTFGTCISSQLWASGHAQMEVAFKITTAFTSQEFRLNYWERQHLFLLGTPSHWHRNPDYKTSSIIPTIPIISCEDGWGWLLSQIPKYKISSCHTTCKGQHCISHHSYIYNTIENVVYSASVYF